VHFSRCLKVSRDGEGVVFQGKSFTCTSDRKGATYNSRKSDGRNKQTISGSLSAAEVDVARQSTVKLYVEHGSALHSM